MLKAYQGEVVVAEAKIDGVGEVQGMQVGRSKHWHAFVNDGNFGGHSHWVQGDEHGVPMGEKQGLSIRCSASVLPH